MCSGVEVSWSVDALLSAVSKSGKVRLPHHGVVGGAHEIPGALLYALLIPLQYHVVRVLASHTMQYNTGGSASQRRRKLDRGRDQVSGAHR